MVFAAEGTERVAFITVEAEMLPVLVMVSWFPLLLKDTPLPLEKLQPDRTPLLSVTVVVLPVMVMVGALEEDWLVKLGIFIAFCT